MNNSPEDTFEKSDSDSSANPKKQPPVQVLSVPELASKWTGNLVSEDPIDKEFRLKQEAYDAAHKRWRINFIILVAVIGLGFVFYLCLQTLSDPSIGANDKKWATVYISSIVTGGIGFLTGKAVS